MLLQSLHRDRDMAKAAAGKRRSYGFIYAALGFVLACIIFRAWSNSGRTATSPPRTASLSFGMLHAQAEDSKWLGPQKGDAPPARLDNYKYQTNKYQASPVPLQRSVGHAA